MIPSRGANSAYPRRPALATLLSAAVLLASVVDGSAATVPLPHLRPHIAGEAGPAPAAPKRGLFGFKKPLPGPSRFSAADQAVLANISGYFNSFQTMEGQFIQFGPQGQQSEGSFYISRPGKIRFHYRPPQKLDVIADGRNVAIRDNRNMTQDVYPLSKTPLRYLLGNNVDLTSDKLVKQVRREPDLISVVIDERSAFASFRLTLLFDSKSYELKQWIVTDAQGSTSTALYNVALNKQSDPGLFKINYLPMR